jgi:hypothetical protein
MIKFPPIKQHKITDKIVYYHKNKGQNILYKMIDTKTGKLLGEMKARPETIRDTYRRFSPNADIYDSFYIEKLQAYKRNSGIGKTFINIAKKESLRYLCCGNIHLIAKNFLNPKDTPFMFYRKMGFSFNKYNQQTQKYIDNCIKTKSIPLLNKTGSQIPMYVEKCVINQKEAIEKMYNMKIKFPQFFNTL